MWHAKANFSSIKYKSRPLSGIEYGSQVSDKYLIHSV